MRTECYFIERTLQTLISKRNLLFSARRISVKKTVRLMYV